MPLDSKLNTVTQLPRYTKLKFQIRSSPGQGYLECKFWPLITHRRLIHPGKRNLNMSQFMQRLFTFTPQSTESLCLHTDGTTPLVRAVWGKNCKSSLPKGITQSGACGRALVWAAKASIQQSCPKQCVKKHKATARDVFTYRCHLCSHLHINSTLNTNSIRLSFHYLRMV